MALPLGLKLSYAVILRHPRCLPAACRRRRRRRTGSNTPISRRDHSGGQTAAATRVPLTARVTTTCSTPGSGSGDKGLFTADGRLGFTVDDAREWFTYWEDLRSRGGTVGADVQTLDQLDIETNALTTGRCAMSFTFSNQLVGYQLVNRNRLGITMIPSAGAGAKSGHYYRPALIWSVAAKSRARDLPPITSPSS
jgi:hypothetical protein